MKKLIFYLGQLGYYDNDSKRANFAYTHSGGRTTHTTELTEDEIKLAVVVICDEYEKARKKLSHTILKKATELGWIKQIGAVQNYEAWNRWMKEKSPFKKEMWQHTYTELKTLNKQIGALHDYYKTNASAQKAVSDENDKPKPAV